MATPAPAPVAVDLPARIAEAASLTLHLDDLLDRVHELVVPDLADLVGIHLPTRAGLARYLAPHTSPVPPYPRRSGLARRLLVDEAMPYDTALPAVRAFTTRTTVLVDDVGRVPQVPDVARVVARGGATGVTLPLVVGDEVLGTLGLARRAGRPQLDAAEVLLAERVAARIAVAVAHARRFDRERRHAEVLQRALLPDRLTAPPGTELTARYVPAAHDVGIGGDWYDVFGLPGGRVGLVIGDVAGRGVRAAAARGQTRAALRAYARLGEPPARVLALLDGFVRDLDGAPLVTAAYAVYDPAARTLHHARAGHLPPVLRAPDGRVRRLPGPAGTALGAGGPQREATAVVPPGTVLVLYTDGLVENRHEVIDTGMDALAAAVGAGPAGLEALAGYLLTALGRDGGHADDVAVLLARLGGAPAPAAAHRR